MCQAVALTWDVGGVLARATVTSQWRAPVPTPEITVQAESRECQFSAIRLYELEGAVTSNTLVIPNIRCGIPLFGSGM